MIKSIPCQLFLLIAISQAMLAAENPAWITTVKTLNLPQKMYNQRESVIDPNFKIHFTTDNKVLISFLQHQSQIKLATKDTPENSGSVFVVLLLSEETGELIKRVEWPVMGESAPVPQMRYGSRIYPLCSGGYVGIINRHLQVFDSSLNVVFDRILETPKNKMYDLMVPTHGRFFIVEFEEDNNLVTEVIDSKTFKTVEHLDMPTQLMDIWDEQLLATSHPDARESRVFKKIIGDAQWNALLTTEKYVNTKFIYNGSILITGYVGQSPDTKGYWFTIEDDKVSKPIFKGLIFKPSWNTSIIACVTSELSDFRRTFDLDSIDWIEAYDLNTRTVIFKTKKYSASDIVDYAISPDGQNIVLMTKKKIEFYKNPHSSFNSKEENGKSK